MYYIALALIAVIFIWRIAAGFRRGMVREIISLIAMAVAGVCVVLIIGAVEKEISKTITMVAVLFIVCVVYRLVHVLFTSLELISRLPVIKGVDKLLGAVTGAAEAGVIVGVLVYLLKSWGLSVLA